MKDVALATAIGGPPPWRVALVDAEVTDVSVRRGGLRFDLAGLPLLGRADALSLVVPQARLELGQARWQGDPTACLGRIAVAEWRTDHAPAWPLQLPEAFEQPVELVFESAQGSRLRVSARSWSLQPRGALRLIETYPC